MKVYEYDVAELAMSTLAGIDDAEEDDLIDRAEQLLAERYNIAIEIYAEIVEDLLPYCERATLPMSNRSAVGFANKGRFLVKTLEPANPSPVHPDTQRLRELQAAVLNSATVEMPAELVEMAERALGGK